MDGVWLRIWAGMDLRDKVILHYWLWWQVLLLEAQGVKACLS